ncbi:DUF4383 domain-containing protein [Saccharopolyspora sp. NPDC002686]|uniref:DUF4383 domain-containing protein n=1 Tax=Saccharopolyspora sp. NPDC002686 TaxID=3154541 RepID=UPI003334184D
MDPRRWSPKAGWQLLLAAEGLLLIALGLLGLANAGWHASGDVPVLLVFQLNTAHSLLLLSFGAVAVLAAPWRRCAVLCATVQTVGGVLLFVYGTAESTLDKGRTPLLLGPAENFLHAGLAVLGFVILCGLESMPRPTHRRRMVPRH